MKTETPKTDSMMRAAGNMKPEIVVVPVAFTRELECELAIAVTALRVVQNRKTIGDEFEARKLVAAVLNGSHASQGSENASQDAPE